MKKYLENDNISSKVIKAAYAIIQDNPGISCADVVEKIHREFSMPLNSGSAIMSVFLHADNTPITHKRYGGRLEDLRVVRPLPKILKSSTRYGAHKKKSGNVSIRKANDPNTLTGQRLRMVYDTIQQSDECSTEDLIILLSDQEIFASNTEAIRRAAADLARATNSPLESERGVSGYDRLKVIGPLPDVLEFETPKPHSNPDDLQAFWDSLSPEQRLRLKIIVFKGTR